MRALRIMVFRPWFPAVAAFVAAWAHLCQGVDRILGIPQRTTLHLQHMNGWSIGIYAGATPVTLAPHPMVRNPVLTVRDVRDVRAAFVADPFMVQHEGAWVLFFEVFNEAVRRGEIAYATSRDGVQWQYQHVILRESFHLSYPYVFWWNDAFYMVPETAAAGEVRLYRARRFPDMWSVVATLLPYGYVDSSLVQHDGRWWMFTAEAARKDTLRLYHAPAPIGPWQEHPASPIVQGDPGRARPAGRAIVHDGRILRFAQDASERYGRCVRTFAVTTLTASSYEEVELGVIAAASGKGWNRRGMHTVDVHEQRPGQWIAAVDGFARDYLFISY